MSKLEVTGLKLQTKDGKKVSLTLEEAKELHEQLDKLFGTDIQYIGPYYVNPYPWRPYYSWTGVSNTSIGGTAGDPNTIVCNSAATEMSVEYAVANAGA